MSQFTHVFKASDCPIEKIESRFINLCIPYLKTNYGIFFASEDYDRVMLEFGDVVLFDNNIKK